MATLHLFRTLTSVQNLASTTSNYILEQDCVVFMDDAVYMAEASSLEMVVQSKNLYSIKEHCLARNKMNDSNITLISIDEFITLSLTYQKVINWQ